MLMLYPTSSGSHGDGGGYEGEAPGRNEEEAGPSQHRGRKREREGKGEKKKKKKKKRSSSREKPVYVHSKLLYCIRLLVLKHIALYCVHDCSMYLLVYCTCFLCV